MKLNKILTLFAALSLVVAPSCSDDDGPLTPLTEVNGENTQIKHNSLTFVWDKVAGATQYGYELYDNDDRLVTRDVTQKTTVTIGNLTPATDYTMKIWAYAAMGSGLTSSEPIVLHATTEALKSLGIPVVTYTKKATKYTFSWKKVTNANGYEYSLKNSSGETIESGSLTGRSLSFVDLEDGDYTLDVTATSTTEGYESKGEAAIVDFNVLDVWLWKATGTYTSSILGTSWEATIACYGDDNYAIKGWYGVDGKNLNFYIDLESDPDDTFIISDPYTYDSSSYLYGVATGRTDIPTVWIYPWWNYSTFTGNQSQGSVGLYVYNPTIEGYSTDTFTWVGEASGITADDLAGTWSMALSGTFFDAEKDDWIDIDGVKEVTLTKIDDTTLAMPALYFSDVTMNVTINAASRTLTAQPMNVWSEYTLAGENSVTAPVVGKINDDGSIEFTDWNAWSEGFVCLQDQKAVLTRK